MEMASECMLVLDEVRGRHKELIGPAEATTKSYFVKEKIKYLASKNL